MRGRRRYEDEPPPAKPAGERPTAELAAAWRGPARSGPAYREESLRIHGLICAKCAREFAPKERHLLTVHHKDGNYRNNPPDGSNWENLCVYCHDDEHSRGR